VSRVHLALADAAAVAAGVLAALLVLLVAGAEPVSDAPAFLGLGIGIGAPLTLAAFASLGLYAPAWPRRAPWSAVAGVGWAGAVAAFALAYAEPFDAPLGPLAAIIVAVAAAVGAEREALRRRAPVPEEEPAEEPEPAAELAHRRAAGPAVERAAVDIPDGPPPAEITVRVNGLSKRFELPHEQVHTLKERVVHPTRRRRFEALQALDDVSFQVERGEFFGIVGRNGSGKSTMMKCLAGIYGADEGEMWLRGRMAPFIELGVGFNPELTARDNVIINAIMLGLTPAQARERYDDIIAFAELEEFVDLKLKNYSSGMHVRLAFSVMVHVDADVLLIDEVLAVGDAAFQQKCFDALNRAHDEGRTILLVTHDMDAVQRFCSRALLLERGVPVALGDAAAVTRRYLQLNFPALELPEDDEVAALPEGDGDGTAHVVDTWFQDATGARAEVLELRQDAAIAMRVRFRQPVTEPVFAFSIFDDQHRRVFTASTQVDGKETGSFVAGEEMTVALSFPNWLGPGRYFVSSHVGHPGGTGLRAMAHREDAATVIVMGSGGGGGLVDIPHEFHVLRDEPRTGNAQAGAEVSSR
jgi:ABC-type polysaccharide/polyol phosphate transport system ATPase subunit